MACVTGVATGAWMEVLTLTTSSRTTPADGIIAHDPCPRATAERAMVEAWRNLGLTYRESNLELSVEAFHMALAHGDPRGAVGAAEDLIKIGRPRQARSLLESAYAMGVQHIGPNLAFAHAKVGLNCPEKAARVLALVAEPARARLSREQLEQVRDAALPLLNVAGQSTDLTICECEQVDATYKILLKGLPASSKTGGSGRC